MNIEAVLPEVGAIIWRDQSAVRADVQRIVSMWSELLEQHRGPMLFGEFSIADAYFAPVCMRIKAFSCPYRFISASTLSACASCLASTPG